MEWTWFKDWWRLKKLRSRHQRHKKKLQAATAAAGAAMTATAVLPGSGCAESGGSQDPQTNRLHSLYDAVPSDGTIARIRHGSRDRLRRNRLLQRQRRSQSAAVHSHRSQDDDDGEYGPFNVSDYEDYGPSHGSDEESDDFCYCDVCMNGDTDFGDSNDGMDSDTSTSSSNSKQVVVGICAMAKKTQSKPMKEILTRLGEFEFIKLVTFEENVILREPVQNWPTCDCLVSFHSKGFPLEKAIEYAQLRNPFVLNNLHMQYDIQDRRRVYAILEKEGIEIPRYAVLDRDSPDPKHHELIESEDHVEVNGITFNKPFVEKPVSAEDHNIYIYYPTSAGGGSQRLFRKIGSRSSVYSPESRVRKTGSFIYEDFMPTDVYFSGTDVKVYTVGPDYAHAEARKSPALDGKVERDSEGKEIRYPVILNHSEKLISRKVCLAFKQTVCGFDLLRANGKSYVCDVNGFSFVKNSNKYYDDCAKILGNMILRELTPTLHIPWSVPFQLDDPPIVPTTFGKMMELRCVVAVIRHGDRTPKQKMKVEVRHPKFFEIFEKYDGYKLGHVKLKRPKQLQEILDIARFLLSEIHTKAHAEIEEKESKLEQLKNVLEMYGHFSGINRKVQMKYQPKGRPRGSSSDDTNLAADQPVEPSLVLILKWGGELTPAGRIQAEELGRIFRCMYPGGQGRSDYSGTQGLGLLRLHSTFRHDLKIYASDEGRVQMTAAAFAKGLLALEGELTPILVQMVKSANTNGLLDNDCDSSKYQNLAKGRLHELMQNDREFSKEDRELINPCNSKSITQALDFVKNPVDCCHHVHLLIRELLHIISIKKDDPKTKDAILYHGETWDLMRCRWEKIEKDFSTKSKLFDISKIPDIYDCIKYDLQHNQHTLQYDQAEELYIYAKNLADIVIPQEYGLTPQEKLAIGQGICSPLLRKIKGDLQRNIDEVEDEFMNRLNPHYSHGVASPQRHVRTRLYFTSESHVHSLLTVLRYGGLLNVVTDEQWRRAMDYISMVSELNYMSQIVIMLYEDPTKDPTSEERFHVELHFSPGVNCCVQKNLPPGPGFRPHSHGDNACNVSLQSSDESNPARIEEENDSNSGEEREGKKRGTSGQRSSDRSAERTSPAFGFNRLELRSKQFKSKPIPIGAHHTVSGHEAMDLAKRLNEELASHQQQQNQQLRPISPDIRAVTPDCEPRSRSFEQRPTSGVCAKEPVWPEDIVKAAEEEEITLSELETKPSLDLTMEIMERRAAGTAFFQPMNRDNLESGEGTMGGGVFLSVCEEQDSGSTCLTPVSFGMDLDLSMVANKGSITLSMEGFEDDEDATLSAATTPSLLADCEPRLESCYCCPSHAEGPPEVPSDDPRFGFALPVRVTQASPEHERRVRRAHDPVSPRIQKQISLFEGNAAPATGQKKTESSGSVGGGPILHASINLPAAGPHHLRQDARLRKFENLTQSTSNSNFPFESNTLKRVPIQTTNDYDNVSHTQSCINLKSGSSGVLGGSPQRQRGSDGRVVAASGVPAEREPPRLHCGRMISTCCSASASPSPSPGALIVKERFIEPPKRGVVRGYHGKTQSMDADFLFNEFLLLPAMAPAKISFDSSEIDQASDDDSPSTSKQRHA
ncbi:inositol hexakisphosphate and diphosphoinositol-pentakisphosphate kinase isoform X16 [Drosophila mauritiana]|uniref:Inositol hexakisphosphate and diphosphoinositol-pentakisphosphate kinase n=1 Tax=Drosophila mauritiana TaxID=7226 RepID=A0A6P8L8X3_DROMA|nr:inositol hexakisphosphate and diphosphoinositol-pentakisphosphate kinase isoform X16 [Drosophila mauritiana]